MSIHTTTTTNGSGGKEVIHIAIGDTSCMITTHLQNLYGLACTTSSSSSNTADDHDGNNNNKNDHYPPASAATPYCNSTPTHGTYQNVYVPRTLLIGNMIGSANMTTSTNDPKIDSTSNNSNDLHQHQQHDPTSTTWNGKAIEVLPNRHNNHNNNNSSYNDNHHHQQQHVDHEKYQEFYSHAKQLAFSPYSRYRSYKNDTKQSSSSHQQFTSINNNHTNNRHVNWDDEMMMMDRSDDDDDDDEMEQRRRRKQSEQMEWTKQYQLTQNAMDGYWDYNPTITSSNTNATDQLNNDKDNSNDEGNTVQQQQERQKQSSIERTWYDYLMPPYHPKTCLDVSNSSSLSSTTYFWNDNTTNNRRNNSDNPMNASTPSYYNTVSNSEMTSYIYDTVWEQYIRLLLEQCDSCQGLLLLEDFHQPTNHSNQSIHAGGWGTQLLQLWNDECSHTVQCTIPVLHRNNSSHTGTTSSSPQQPQPQQNHRAIVRSQIEECLLLADQTALSTTVLPIQLPTLQQNNVSLSEMEAAAIVAMSIESSTLPYRIVDGTDIRRRSQLSVQAYYGGAGGGGSYGTIPNLSYREYIRTMLRQSASKNILEIDCMLPYYDVTTKSSLLHLLQQGTSIERDQRMKQSRGYQGNIHRPVDTAPGEWMNTTTPSISSSTSITDNSNINPCILSSLSPQPTGMTFMKPPNNNDPNSIYDRNLHKHYALSTSLRLPSQSNNRTQTKTTDYVTCIMESMGIRYRPEQSICTVLDQSYQDLIVDGYGAGSYWKSIFRHHNTSTVGQKFVPNGMISVLGNTTRIYPYLAETAVNAENIISPSRNNYNKTKRKESTMFRSYYSRDATDGLLPEIDDCKEAVTNCLDIRDSYEPPNGSGLILDEEGDYFDH